VLGCAVLAGVPADAARPDRDGLTEDWSAVRPGGPIAGLVSDGRRVVAIGETRAGPAGLAGYDGATGARLWRARLPWAHTGDPVGGRGVVIVPSGAESGRRPIDYVALDTATGVRRWRVHVRTRAFPAGRPATGRPQAAGALLGGVFYYADGRTVTGVDAATGKVRHRFTSRYATGVAGPVAAGGRIVLLARPPGARSGRRRVLLRFAPDLTPYPPIEVPGPTARGPDRVAASGRTVLTWGPDVLQAVDARDGRALYRRKTNRWAETDGVTGGTVLVHGTENGHALLLALDLRTDRRLWSFRIPRRSGIDAQAGAVFVIGPGVAAVDPRTGRTVYTHAARSSGPGLAVPAAGRIVVADQNRVTGYR